MHSNYNAGGGKEGNGRVLKKSDYHKMKGGIAM
jgi:hypothetical protein